jgi:hypothetical protein
MSGNLFVSLELVEIAAFSQTLVLEPSATLLLNKSSGSYST